MSLVTGNHVTRFERDGFVVVEDVLNAEELERFGAAVDAAVDVRTEGDTRKVSEKSLYEQSFIQCMNLWEDFPAVRPLSFHPRLGEAAAALLGAKAVRVWHDQALYKEPGGRETDPHQDLPFWPITPSDQASVWIPFEGSTREGGGMAYVPGSHRVGLAKFVDITHSLHPEPYDILADPKIRDIEPVWVEVQPGAVVFHHSLCVHLAAPNASDRMRRVHTVIYFADGCVRSKPWPHVSVDRQGIAVGEPVRGEVTPIAWPRAEGDWPPAPSDGRVPRLGFR
ncbi:MAG: phytanoyl-CoA dioxygenase family protein [Myxococcota bacterium]